MPNAGDVIYIADHARMGCELRRAAAQTLPDATDTVTSWDTEVEDTHNLWTSGTTVTIPTGGGGLWAITYGIVTTAVSTARSLMFIAPSASIWSSGGSLRNSFGADEDTSTVSATIPLVAGVTLTFSANVNMAGAATFFSRLSCYRVGL